MERFFFGLCCALAATILVAADPADARKVQLAGTIWDRAAQAEGIDPYLLYAVSLVESRKLGNDNLYRPHPHALNIRGLPYFPVSRAHAEKTLAACLAYTDLIDVGMMQVNIRYHRDKVADPYDLLDPQTNIRVAAQILRDALDSAPNNLVLGVGRYHSPKPERAIPYGRRVLKLALQLKQ